jgi:hypothetical protein
MAPFLTVLFIHYNKAARQRHSVRCLCDQFNLNLRTDDLTRSDTDPTCITSNAVFSSTLSEKLHTPTKG